MGRLCHRPRRVDHGATAPLMTSNLPVVLPPSALARPSCPLPHLLTFAARGGGGMRAQPALRRRHGLRSQRSRRRALKEAAAPFAPKKDMARVGGGGSIGGGGRIGGSNGGGGSGRGTAFAWPFGRVEVPKGGAQGWCPRAVLEEVVLKGGACLLAVGTKACFWQLAGCCCSFLRAPCALTSAPIRSAESSQPPPAAVSCDEACCDEACCDEACCDEACCDETGAAGAGVARGTSGWQQPSTTCGATEGSRKTYSGRRRQRRWTRAASEGTAQPAAPRTAQGAKASRAPRERR